MRTAFLQERHRRGDDSDPFVEAERRAVAQRDAAAKRIVHPTLHLPAPPQPVTTPTTTPGLFGSQQQPGIFQNQPATPPASQSLFGSSPAPTANLFGSTTPTTAGASSSSLFGSAFAPTTPAGMFFFGSECAPPSVVWFVAALHSTPDSGPNEVDV